MLTSITICIFRFNGKDEAVELFNLQYEETKPVKFQPKRCQSFDFTGKSQVPSPLVVLSTMPRLFQSQTQLKSCEKKNVIYISFFFFCF